MPKYESQKRANAKYIKAHIKRIPLDVQNDFFDQVKEAAAAAGESVNGFIKRAIIETTENDKKRRAAAQKQ